MDSSTFKDKLCTTCLSIGKNLKPVENEKMKYFYVNTISELQIFSMAISIPSICWECYAHMRKAINFKEQVQHCYEVLQNYSQEDIQKENLTRPPQLELYKTTQIDISPSVNTSQDVDGVHSNLELSTVKDEIKENTKLIEENVSIKTENQPSSDDDNTEVFCTGINTDIPVVRNSIVKRVHEKRRKKITKTKHRNKINNIKTSQGNANELKEKLVCTECKKTFRNTNMYMIHCKKHFVRKKERKKPEKEEEMLKCRVQCPECDKTFSYKSGLNNHTLAVHKMNSNFQCEECGKIFKWRNSLNKHMVKHETGQKSQAAFCNECGIGFTTICSYKRHMLNSLKHVTQEQYRFICDHCNSKFANKTKLRDHIEEKHLQRAFRCHICLKQSKNRVCLDQHIRNVHKGRPNNKICHHCGKGFPTNLQLDSHIRSHTGEKPFLCKFCPSTFSQRSNLNKHHKQVHLNLKSKRQVKVKEDKATNQNQAHIYTKPSVVLHYDVEKDFLI